ncbi:MAG: hypothetical protein FWF85_06115 [Clostridiales bacterium]|nr:hypothetical protein [Clostridiales bacterium]
MRLSKLKKQLKDNYGIQPSLHYFAGAMQAIRTYFDYRRDNHLDEFLLDDTTWHDLSGDDIFKRINSGLSSSGEQYLYYLLRSPAIEKSEYDKRAEFIGIMEHDPDLRLKLQVVLAKLGRRHAANTCEAFQPSSHSPKKLLLYLLLVLALIAGAISLIFTTKAMLLFICLLIFIPSYHQFASIRMERDLATVTYSVAMVFAVRKIQKIASPKLDQHLTSFYESGRRLKAITRIGHVPTNTTAGEFAALLNSLLLLDLITYEFHKNRLGKHHADIFQIHEYLGRIDSAIAISSYRKSLDVYSIPQIDFSPSASVSVYGINLVHPLIENAVPNDLATKKPVLLTGSNASGKSTFLKTVAVNAILAQGICTAIGNNYFAPAFRIYSSMAIADNLLAGESYYISEIKSLKRIMDADASKQPLLCVIDEVLRGTNTVERIAASAEFLKYLTGKKMICLAATHDIELCTLLAGYYRLLHFEETITDEGEILFDYTIKDGPATTRNALKLLSSMGFDQEMVNRANEKANMYIAVGKWM